MVHIAGGLPQFALLETLQPLNLTDEITQSRGMTNRECVALDAANMVSGAFGGIGGARQ